MRAGVGVLLLCAVHAIAGEPGIPRTSLGPTAGLDDDDRDRVSRGRVIVKFPDPGDRAEIAIQAVVRLEASRSEVLECFRDVACLHAHGDLLAGGRFSALPGPADLDTLRLDSRDLRYLSRCRTGDCDVRLPAAAIERFRREVDWDAAGAGGRAETLWREVVASLAASYREGGRAALPEYHDDPHPVPVAAALERIAGRSWPLLSQAPELRRQMDRADDPLPDAEEALVWHDERHWRKNVLQVDHLTLLDRSDARSIRLFALSTQVFASHYYEANAEVLAFLAPVDGGPGHLVFSGRARADIRPSGFSWLERLLIRRLAGRRLEARLRALTERLRDPSRRATRDP